MQKSNAQNDRLIPVVLRIFNLDTCMAIAPT